MRHMSVDIPISCPRLLGCFFGGGGFPPSRRFVLLHNLSRTWPDFSVRGHELLWGLAGAHPVFHHLSWEHASLYSTKKKNNKKNIQQYSEFNSSGGLTEHVIWEGSMYTVWLRTRVCFTWKFPPCECTTNPTRLVNLADYQLANELMMEILYKWGTMLRSNVSTFKNEAHSSEHEGVFECEGCGLKPRLSSQRVCEQGEFHYRWDTDNLTRHTERFPNPLDLFYISDWESCLERGGSFKKKNGKVTGRTFDLSHSKGHSDFLLPGSKVAKLEAFYQCEGQQ